MHVPDGVLEDPRVVVATAVAGAAFLGLAARRVDRSRTVLLGSTAAFVFAAQMVNFPLGPLPISGHLLGGVLAATIVGPWGGALVIASVLIVQCVLFGDGGFTALGANFLNMGVIGAIVGYSIYATIRRAVGGRAGVLIGATAAAWIAVVLAAGAFSLELAAAGRREDFFGVLGWMTLVHALIGVGEAAITGLVLRFVLQTRPDLIYEPDDAPIGRPARWAHASLAALAVALAVAVFVAPWASSRPDGLEFVSERLSLPAGSEPSWSALVADYGATLFAGRHVRVATAIAGTLGTITVCVLGLTLGRLAARATPRPEELDAV